jgi:uncharacterized membrane protein
MHVGTYQVVLVLHLLGAFMFVAGIVLTAGVFEVARRRPEPAEVALLLATTRLGVLLVALGTVLTGAFGLWLVHLGHWGYGSTWVSTSIALYAAALALGGLGGRRPKQARRRATRLAREGERADDELRALLDDPLSRAANYASLLMIVAVVVLMVLKP